MRLKRLLKIFSVVFGLLATAGFFAVEKVLPYTGIKPYRMVAAHNTWRFPNGFLPQNYDLRGKEVFITTPDSILLKGWFLKTQRDTVRGTVIILHGISSCKETQFGRAKILAEKGFNGLALDLRAHGESGGDYCTFGFYEKHDIAAAVDSVLRWTNEKPVGIWGASLGAAIALQTMAMDERIGFGIIESTFDEFEKVAEEYGADYMLGLRSKYLVQRVISKSAQIAQFDPRAVKPVEAAATIARPMLFIHGDADDKIPFEFNRRNFEAVPSADKHWVTVEGGGHSNLWRLQGERLSREVGAFLEQRKWQ